MPESQLFPHTVPPLKLIREAAAPGLAGGGWGGEALQGAGRGASSWASSRAVTGIIPSNVAEKNDKAHRILFYLSWF